MKIPGSKTFVPGMWILIPLLCLVTSTARAANVPQPLSDQVQTMLKRAQTAIGIAEATPFLEQFFVEELEEWIGGSLSVQFATIGTDAQITAQTDMLGETACFRYDLWVVEQQLLDIRERLVKAQNDFDIFAIFHLEDAYAFLSREYEALRTGGTQRGMQSTEWDRPLLGETSAPVPDAVCYYHSDYTKPGRAGYGCGSQSLQTVLDRLSGSESARGLRESVEAELRVETDVESALRNADSAQDLFSRLREGADQIVSGASAEDEENEPPVSFAGNRPEAEQGCDATVRPGIIGQTLHGPFSLEKDAEILFAFRTLTRQRDIGRAEPEEGDDDPEEAEPSFFDFFTRNERNVLNDFTASQARRESAIFAAGVDPLVSSDNAFTEMRAAIGSLVRIGNSLQGGLRGFVRDFAFFLKRTCVDRPCGQRLDTVLKLVFTDECFAYGNARYLQATEEDPQWKRCLCTAMPESPECQ